MIEACSDWMSFDDAVAYVEARQECYEHLAIELLQKAAHDLKIRTRLVQYAAGWVVLPGDGFKLDNDNRDMQLCREDILKLWPEQKKKVVSPSRSKGAISVGVSSALDALWPGGVIPEGVRAKDRNEKVRQWLKDHDKSIPRDLAKAVQRAVRRVAEAS